MQNTPFRYITHHEDGGHKFTVAVDTHRKVFVANSVIPIRKAIEFAIRFRDSVLPKPFGIDRTAQELRNIDRFVTELENPVMDKPILPHRPVTVKPASQKDVKVTVLPAAWDGVIKAKAPKSTPAPRKTFKNAFARMMKPNSTYPNLPSSCTPVFHNHGVNGATYLSFTVAYKTNGVGKNRTFYIGPKDKLDLKRYRMVRHVAIKFRQEYIKSAIDGVEFDTSPFDNWSVTIFDGTFKWPFTGTLPERRQPVQRVRGVTTTTKAQQAAVSVIEYLSTHAQLQSAFDVLSDEQKKTVYDELSSRIRVITTQMKSKKK